MLEQLRLKQFEKSGADNAATMGTTIDTSTAQQTVAISSWAAGGLKDKTTSQNKINYAQSIAKIQEVTGLTDIQEIINKFLEAEEQNFSLFNYMNEINMEIERLEHATTICAVKSRRIGVRERPMTPNAVRPRVNPKSVCERPKRKFPCMKVVRR
jgi:hypothetical protein